MAIGEIGLIRHIEYCTKGRQVRESVVSEKKTTTAALVGCYIRIPEGKCSETDQRNGILTYCDISCRSGGIGRRKGLKNRNRHFCNPLAVNVLCYSTRSCASVFLYRFSSICTDLDAL